METALEDLKREVEDDHKQLLEEHQETLEEAELEHEGLVGDQIEDLDAVTDAYIGLLENFRTEYGEFMERRSQELEGMELRRQRVIDSYLDILEDAREEYRKLLDDQIDALEELVDHKRRGAGYSFFAGSVLVGAGLIAATAHPATDSFLEFYAEGFYMDDPETAVMTLGLPAAGIYLFKKAYDRTREYRELTERLGNLDRLRLDDRLERTGEEEPYTEM